MALDIKWVVRHDWFNMVVLPVVSVCNVLYLMYPEEEFYFWLMFKSFLAYITVDAVFVTVKPNCVGSPGIIQVHHFITIFGWCLQLVDERMRMWSAMALLVELNTWFKISKRYLKGYMLVDALFYLSWFVLRVVMYPYLCIATGRYFVQRWTIVGSVMDPSLPHFLLCIVLTCMNIKWTWDLTSKGGYLGVMVENHEGKMGIKSMCGKKKTRTGTGGERENSEFDDDYVVLDGDLSKLKVTELRAALKERDLPVGRTKAEMIDTLENWQVEQGFL
jgi:hypothetical protein